MLPIRRGLPPGWRRRPFSESAIKSSNKVIRLLPEARPAIADGFSRKRISGGGNCMRMTCGMDQERLIVKQTKVKRGYPVKEVVLSAAYPVLPFVA